MSVQELTVPRLLDPDDDCLRGDVLRATPSMPSEAEQ